jgi:L,D-peptidoglycan transpeptidase YkuD (ErfK/YbiS/YcfS/YnhG family)
VSGTPSPRGCPAALPAQLITTGGAGQLVTVESAPGATPLAASVELWQLEDGCWARVGGPWSGWLGAHGFSDHHQEGDATTPTGLYRFGPIVYGNAANPGTKLPYHRLVCGDWWDEDPTSVAYNTFQHVFCGQAPPFRGGSEALWTETAAYPSFAVIEYNAGPVVPDAGSAIFLHADTGGPTNGCVSLPQTDLDYLLRWLDPADSPSIVMGPSTEIARF